MIKKMFDNIKKSRSFIYLKISSAVFCQNRLEIEKKNMLVLVAADSDNVVQSWIPNIFGRTHSIISNIYISQVSRISSKFVLLTSL